MHVHVLEDGYAARACDLYSYKTVSRDVLDKWAYPFCPDRAWSNPADVTNSGFGNRYIVRSEKISRYVGNTG